MEEQRNQDSDFLKETIKQRPLNKKKLIRRTLITAAMAVIFGLVACLTFLLLEPVISNRLYPEEEPSTVIFVEETAENEKLPEDMIADDSQMKPEPIEKPVLEEEQIAQVLSEIQMGTEEYISLYSSLSDIAKEMQKSMVTVVGVTSGVDWFNNAYENEGRISGVVVADNGKEYLILANINTIQKADSIKVTFYDGKDYQATVKKKDYNTGLAIMAVTKANMKPGTIEIVKPASLGTSAGLSMVGNPVIAVGQPVGNTDSVCYGFITSVNNPIYMPDSVYKLITTDIYGSAAATGALINLKGQVTGIIDTSHNSADTKNLISAIGITELKRVLDILYSEKDMVYLGVYGADVSEQANEELKVPFGAYIMEIEMDSPAMNAGIQSGDVIIKANETDIGSYSDLVNMLLILSPEDNVSLTIMRQGPDGYTEMEAVVVLGGR